MKRRKFLLTSGSTILTGTAVGSLQQPGVALEFELSAVANDQPSNVDSILVKFTKFKITPRYLDENSGLNITVRLDLEGESPVTKTANEISFTNGTSIDDTEIQNKSETDISNLVIDELQKSGNNLPGTITVTVDHPDISTETYQQSFEINQTNIIDAFEDGNISEYSGSTGNVNIVNSPVKSGSNAAQILEGNNLIYSPTENGLDNYPSQGDVFRWNTYIRNGSRPIFAWGLQDSSNYYYLQYDEPKSTLRLYKVDAGTESELSSVSVTFEIGAYSETEVEWRTNGRQLIKYFDSSGSSRATIDYTDTTFSSGGVGWGEYSKSPISYWPLREGTGSTVTDYEGSNNGSINGATWNTSRTKTDGVALTFDGNNSYVTFNDTIDGYSEIFVYAWVYPTTNGTNRNVVSKTVGGSSSPDASWNLQATSVNDWNFYIYDAASGDSHRASGGSVNKNSWQHIAAGYDGQSIKIYKNANEIASNNIGSYQIQDTTTNAELGRRQDDSNYFTGTIDEVKIFNDERTASQVQDEYDRTV